MKKDPWRSLFSDKELSQPLFRAFGSETVGEIKEILKKAKLGSGERILDVGCGIGRHSIELAKRGFEVTGFDYSKAYLAQANRAKKKAKIGHNLQFVRGDVRKLHRHFPPTSFAQVIFLHGILGIFEDPEDNREVLRQLARVLRPGGALVLNVADRPQIEASWRDHRKQTRMPYLRFEEYKRGSYFLLVCNYDPKTGIMASEWFLLDLKKNHLKRLTLRQRCYSRSEFLAMIRPLGLKVESEWRDLDGRRKSKKYAFERCFVLRINK